MTMSTIYTSLDLNPNNMFPQILKKTCGSLGLVFKNWNTMSFELGPHCLVAISTIEKRF
jgi:hypothetical protein